MTGSAQCEVTLLEIRWRGKVIFSIGYSVRHDDSGLDKELSEITERASWPRNEG